MGTRIVLMRDGVVQQFGSPREIYTSPANVYVARFIGTPPMNLIRTRLEAGALIAGEARLALPPQLRGRAEPGDLLLGVRPTALAVTTPGSAGTLAGRVTLVEHVGAESLVAVALDQARTAHDEEGATPGEIMITIAGYSELRAGDAVGVSLNLAEAVLFSPETGERLAAVPAPGLVPVAG